MSSWVRLYNSLFVVMNEWKQIVSWYFTKKESFSFAQEVLGQLEIGNDIEYFIIDNCCKWKAKIKELFGENIKVKLDPFHGIQRITSTIRKTNRHHSRLCADLQSLLRQTLVIMESSGNYQQA